MRKTFTTVRWQWALGVALVVALWGCQNPVSWESDVHLPILDDQVSWADVVPDSLYEPGTGGNPAHFVLVDTLDGWDWTDLSTLPDSTLRIRYDGEGGGLTTNGIPVFPNQSFVVLADVLQFDVAPEEGVALTKAEVTSGSVLIQVEHSLGFELNLSYQFPDVLVEGGPLAFALEVPSAEEDQVGVASQSVDLTGAMFDFSSAFNVTDNEGYDFNALDVELLAVADEFNDPNGYIVQAEDSLVISLTFQGLTVSSLAGYFGNYEESTSADVDLLDTIPLPEPIIDLEGTQASLHFTNTVGADFLLSIDTMQFDDELVEGDLIAGHLIPRAIWQNDIPQPAEWSLDLGAPGSTFLDLLETFPRSLHVAGRMELNPINTSDLLIDRWDVAYPPTFWYQLRVPLKLGVNGLVLTDTFDLEGLQDFPKFEGFLHLDFSNSFPVEVTGEVTYDRLDGVVYRDTLVLPPGDAWADLDGQATLSLPLNAEMVEPGGTVAVSLSVNTSGPQPFTGFERVRVQGRLEGTQTIEIENE